MSVNMSLDVAVRNVLEQDKEQGEESIERAVKFVQSLDWQVYNQELSFGESVNVWQRAILTESDAAEFYGSGASRIKGLRTIDVATESERDRWSGQVLKDINLIEEETDEKVVMILTGGHRVRPEHLGDPDKFSVDEPPPESWSIPSPVGTEYLPFQRASIWELINRPMCMLADDMGLGKTIQAIGMLNYLRPDRVCIIATAGLKKVWLNELNKWLVYDIPIRVMNASHMLTYKQGVPGIYVTNYEAVRDRDARDFLHDEWDQIILDESHNIKNGSSKTAKAILGGWDAAGNKLPGLQAPRKLMISGTPMPNRAIELWTTFSYLFPQVFNERIYTDYKREFASGGTRTYVRNAKALKRWFRAITIRRRKITCLRDLPEKERETQMVSVNAMNMTRLHEMENQALAEAFGGYSQSISFSQWSAIRAECARIKASNNAEYMLRYLFANPGEKVVVFRHHQVTRKALSEGLSVCGIKHVYYEGGMTPEKKDDAVYQFQNDPECRAIIVSIKAGGLGITLTESKKAIFAEIDCVPSSLLQCEDRIHRIGQTEKCSITYLYIHGSIEEHMANIVAAKLPQIESVVDDDDVKHEHLVEAEVDISAIFEGFRKDQQGWDRLRDIHDILRTATKPDGQGGLERKYDWHTVGRFGEYYPEYKKGVPKKERDAKAAA